MKINMYDFDDTIYDGDSSVDFIKYCYKKGYIKIKQKYDKRVAKNRGWLYEW